MAITKSGSKVTVGAITYKGKNVAKRIFDLKSHKGERIRVHIGNDDKLTIETRPTQKDIVCELDIPMLEWVRTEKMVNGETVTESKEKALKLEDVNMKKYLEEEIKK